MTNNLNSSSSKNKDRPIQLGKPKNGKFQRKSTFQSKNNNEISPLPPIQNPSPQKALNKLN